MNTNPIIIIGKMGSGKTSVAECLCRVYSTRKLEYKKVVTYTTRRPRQKETDDDYHFVTNEEFNELVENEVINEYHQFFRKGQLLQYGSSFADYRFTVAAGRAQIKIVILDPDGLHKALRTFKPSNLSVIYLRCSEDTLHRHLAQRGDDPEEVKRRLSEESEKFASVNQYADLTINCDSMSINQISNIIDRYVHGDLY